MAGSPAGGSKAPGEGVHLLASLLAQPQDLLATIVLGNTVANAGILAMAFSVRPAPGRPAWHLPEGSPPHEDSLKKPWREPLDSLEFDPMPRIHDLRHCWKTNVMRSGLHPLITDVIVGHGDWKKDVKTLYLTISDADLVRAVDGLTFDHGETEILVATR